jgi:hypothetical protein
MASVVRHWPPIDHSPAVDLVDHAPGDLAHVLALDADHRVGETLGDLRLLLGREHPR